MVGTTVRALRLAIVILLSAGTAVAGPVTSYDCAPGTPVKGVGCSCPKSYKGKAYTPKRDSADPGRAICAVQSSRPYRPRGNYTKLVEQANNYADAFNCTKAEETYQQALKVNSRGLEALVGSGNCMVRERKWTNAHMRFDRALAINRKYEPALWGKAEAYRLAYKKDDAIAAYRQYLDAYPNSYKAKQALEKLTQGAPQIGTPPVRPGRYPTRTQDVNVSISGSNIVCNGVAVSGTPRLADFEAIYGKPDRVWDTKGGVNKVHTWDRLGLVVYEPKDGRAISATFPFKPMGMAYDPSTMFRGSITVDGYALSRATSLGSVKNRPGATQPYSSTSVVIAKGDFNVFVTGKSGPLDLVELSLWKRGNSSTNTSKYKNTRDVRVVVNGTRVTMNGVTISGRPMLADIEKIYGKPDRTWDTGASNRVHTWDKLGLVVYEPRDGRCISTTFPYKPMGSSYDPSTMFGGSIIVDGRSVTKFLTIPSIKSRPGATQPYGKNSIVFDKGDIHVFTISKKGGPIDLVEISYWQRDKRGTSLGGNNTTTSSGGRVANAKDVRVEVVGTTVKLQGVAISGKPRVSDITAIYGKPDRVWDKKGSPNRIHTWDNLGFVVYEPHDGRAISLTMPFKPMNNTFSPRTLFKGRVSLDRRGFYNFNTIGTIKRRKGATQPYGATSVVFDLGDVHVFTTASKSTSSTIDLVEVSFWQHK